MRKNLIAGAAILALLMNSPQISAADDDVVIFGKEFDDGEKKPHEVERPDPIRELPPPIDKPVEQPAPPVDKPVEQPAPPVDKPVEQPAPPTPEPVNETPPVNDDDDLGDILVFDDISRERIEQPVNETPPEPVQEPEPVDEPFRDQRPEPVQEPPPVDEPVREPQPEPVQEPVERPSKPENRRPNRTPVEKPSNAKLKQLKQRFVKLAVDETYIYYLDKTSVQWRKMPYSTSEYMADFWVRMIEREPQDNGNFYGADDDSIEILSAHEKGYRYRPEDEEILRRQSYVLEHYYLRPKTKQIQFLCELEVFGRPQNTIDEREYDYRNWENLVPGSVESVIYASVVKLLDLTKDNPKGHMTVSDMLDEYLRISL